MIKIHDIFETNFKIFLKLVFNGTFNIFKNTVKVGPKQSV